MHKSIILKNKYKLPFRDLVLELLGDEFTIKSYDLEFYHLTSIKSVEGIHMSYDQHWTELAIGVMPEKLGMPYLIIPINDQHFNLAEYLISYYEDMVNNPNKEEVTQKRQRKRQPIKNLLI